MNLIGTKVLETERLFLRRISLNDANDIYMEILGNKERLHFIDWNYALDASAAKVFIENIINSYHREYYFFWIIEEKVKHDFVGCILVCNSDEKRRLAEIEYVASEKTQGHGYMTEALSKVIDFLVQEVGYYRIEGVCNIENRASAKVMEKAGMVLEGILRGRALNLNEEGNPGDLKMYSFIPSDNESRVGESVKQYRNEYVLRDGQKFIIRTPDESDAQELIVQLQTVDNETKFLAREPGEFRFTVEQEKAFIRNRISDENGCFLIGELDGRIIANCSVGIVMNNKRFLHRAAVGIAVMKDYWNKGIGKKLMLECIEWCKEKGIEQLELEVVAQNNRAITMYENLGFKTYGTKKHALKYSDGTYDDEYYMILFLNKN